MSVKLLMQWDIQSEKASEYSNFIAHEFIPRIQRLGLDDIQLWYTTYGNCEQIQASGMLEDKAQASLVLESDEWDDLLTRLNDLVTNYTQKMIAATKGFQL